MAKAFIKCTTDFITDLISVGHLKGFDIKILTWVIQPKSDTLICHIECPSIPKEFEGKGVSLNIRRTPIPQWTDNSPDGDGRSDGFYAQAYSEFNIKWDLINCLDQ